MINLDPQGLKWTCTVIGLERQLKSILRGLGFSPQHPYGASQPLVTAAPQDPTSSSSPCEHYAGMKYYMQDKHSYTCNENKP